MLKQKKLSTNITVNTMSVATYGAFSIYNGLGIVYTQHHHHAYVTYTLTIGARKILDNKYSKNSIIILVAKIEYLLSLA